MSERTDDRTIALAAFAGCQPHYFDYGHPERLTARKYWTAPLPDGRIAYGYTRADCARTWMLLNGLGEFL